MADNNQPANPQATGATPGDNNGQPGNPQGNNNGGQSSEPMVQVSQKELDELKSDAGRWKAHRQSNKGTQRKRSWEKDDNDDGDGSGESLEVRKAREEAEAAKKEAFGLKLERQVEKVLNSDEYKDLSPAAKRLIARNPMAYIDSRSQTVEDAIADIQDFLDGELENLVEKPGGQPATPKTETPSTPPASSSRPTTTAVGNEESVEGKTGPARSTTVLKNLMKRAGIAK